MQKQKPALIVALDNLENEDPLALIDELSSLGISWFKVGLELFTSQGPKIIQHLKQKNLKIFLDLKYLDIPNTVFRATESAAKLGADILTVHSIGGMEMLSAAKTGAQNSNLKIIGVTVLTSFGTQAVDHLSQHFSGSATREELASRLAKDVALSKLDGVVSSAYDLPLVKASLPQNGQTIFLTPGIRMSGDAVNDQKSIATPKEAILYGATHLVVGRPILSYKGKAREEKVAAFLKEIEA